MVLQTKRILQSLSSDFSQRLSAYFAACWAAVHFAMDFYQNLINKRLNLTTAKLIFTSASNRFQLETQWKISSKMYQQQQKSSEERENERIFFWFAFSQQI